MEQTLRVSIYGTTGYTGVELLSLLLNHPKVRVVNLISSSYSGKRLEEVLPAFSATPLADKRLVSEPEEDFDLAFLCLPHEVSLELVPKLLEAGKKVIDLSGAYRIEDPKAYEEFYGFKHTHPELLRESVYGLAETFRDSIKGAKLVANPGCYPTATLLAIYPLLVEGVKFDRVIVHALSGVSGAGRKLKQQFHFPEMTENFFPYSVEKHRHTPEMEDVIRRISSTEVRIRFVPTVVPASRGMVATVYVEAEIKDVKELFREVYRNEIFVKVVDEVPKAKWVVKTNMCLIYPCYDDRTEILTVISAIDNLGKGASYNAVQNMNLVAGFEEDLGIPKVGSLA